MASKSGDSGGFGAFLIGVIADAAGLYYGPRRYQRYVHENVAPQPVRVEVGSDYTPGVWRREARLAIEFSSKRADGKDWDWPMTSPELQVCIRETNEYRKCWGPSDMELKMCQGHFQCVTGPM